MGSFRLDIYTPLETTKRAHAEPHAGRSRTRMWRRCENAPYTHAGKAHSLAGIATAHADEKIVHEEIELAPQGGSASFSRMRRRERISGTEPAMQARLADGLPSR